MNTKMKKAETNRQQKTQQAQSSNKQARPVKTGRATPRFHEQELIETRMFD